MRHLTDEERKRLRDMATAAGIPEMLRTLGSLVANDHPDMNEGDRLRSALNDLAKQAHFDQVWAGQQHAPRRDPQD